MAEWLRLRTDNRKVVGSSLTGITSVKLDWLIILLYIYYKAGTVSHLIARRDVIWVYRKGFSDDYFI